MADGNLGSLWMSLGLKETVTDGLKKVLSSLDKTDEKSAAVGKEIKSFVKELNSAKVSDSILKSIGRIGELLSVSTSGAESLGRVLKGLNVKEMSALGGNVNMSNLKEAHSLITKIMQAMSSRNMSNASMDKFFELGNAQGFLTQIMTIDKNLKSLKDSSKGITDTVLKGDAETLVNKLTSLRKQFLESFNSGAWRGNNAIQGQLNNATNSLIQFYDKLNASKGNQSLFDSVPKEAAKATEALKAAEEQAKKTAEAVASIGTKRKPAVENPELAKEIERLTKNPVSMKEGSNDFAGIKKQADDASKSVIKLKYDLNEVLNAFRGSASKNLGVGEAGEKGRQLVDILNQINKKKEELSRKEGGAEAVKEMGAMVNNAMSYLRLLQRIEIAERGLQEKKSANPNVDASKFKEASNAIAHFRDQLVKLESAAFLTGVDGANVLKNYASAWQMTLGDVDKTIGKFQKRNPLSDLDSNFSKIDSKIDSFREKLAKLRDLMSEGTHKGFNTSMLTDRITGMSGIVAQMEKAMNNEGKMLSNADRMKQLFSDMQVEMSKTTAALQAYGREKGKAITQERESNAAIEKSKRAQRELADNTRNLKDLYSQLNHQMAIAEQHGMKGLQLGVSTSQLDKALSDMRDFASIVNGVSPGLMGKGGRPVLADYKQQANDLKRALLEAVAAQKELNNAQERSNRKAEAKSERDKAQAIREQNAAEKQRQAELENSLRRIQSMEKALANLQEKRFTSKMFGLDISEADAKIFAMKIKLNELYDIANKLRAKDMTAVGKLGNLGNGRETQAANDLARSYDKANKEAQRGVEIEQKRQQEIAKSAAKVQADLVRGFEKANSHASKLNSTIQDLKSLFLQGGLVFGAQQFAMSIITTGGEMEKQHIALQSILGDMQNANTLFGQIKELALNSPFTFSELNRDVKQLAAYGVEYDQLYDTTKRLADMSSGLGVSFDRIALAFGQVQARGWLDGKELRQIAYAGIPLLDKLSDFYSKQEGRKVSTSEIKTRISNREVSFDDVKNIFWQMTDAGGQFYNMQQTLSETLLGRYNKLKDAWEIMLADFANGKSVVGGTFMFIINRMTDLVQLMHSFSPMLLGLFSGVAMKKIGVALAGSAALNFLSNKEKVAQDIKARAIAGQQLSQTEMRVLATKKQITREDLQALITAKAITKTELQRLYLSGKISKEMYKQAVTSAGMNNFWTNFANKGGVAISLLGKGIVSLGHSLWTMIGGWPGLILTAVTASIGYIYSEYQDLSQKIKQTQDELADRNSQILSFLKDNNVSVAITKGDDKEIDNMIDAYKEKLKQIAPYDYHNLVMTADEMKSHKDRLVYLEKELKLLKEANDVANNKMSNRSFYSDMSDDTEKAIEALNKRQEMQIAANKPGASVGEKQMYADEKAYGDYIEKLKDRIAKKFGDIAKDEKMRQAAMQSMSALFSSLGVPEDKADILRTSLLQAFGIGDKSNWLQTQVGDKMRSLIDSTFPLIGDKIKSSIPLTEAEKAKVKELMGDAKNGLIQQYPELERTLQGMLAASKFEAVIKLVVDGGSYNDMQSELVGRIPKGPLKPELLDKYRKRAKDYGKDNDWYGGRNASHSNIDKAYNNWQSAKKSGSKQAPKLEKEYNEEREISRTLLHDDYAGEGKKSNKPGKKNNGRKEDSELKDLQERLSSLKSARQMYQKYSSIMSDKEAADKTYKLFPEVKGLDLKDYQVAVRKLLEGFKINTTERKKFQTSVYREVAEWLFSEKDKKEFDKKAADYTEEMNKLSDRWDLYKSLLEKTGNKEFAGAAWIDSFQMDEKTKSLMDQYYQDYGKLFNLQDALYLSDGDAKEKLNGPGEYEAWKKIVDLLRENYVKSLQDGAEAMSQTMSIAQKLDSVTRKYDEKRKNAGKNQYLIDRYNYLEQNEKSGILFDQLKSEVNWEGVFGNIDKYSRKELRKIRKDINNLIGGGLLKDMSTSDLKSFYDGMDKLNQAIDGHGFSGLKDLIREMVDASKEYDDATNEYNAAVEKYGKNDYRTEEARKRMQDAQNRRRNAGFSVDEKRRSRINDIVTIADMFRTLGSGDGSGSTLLSNVGSWISTLMSTFGGDNAKTNSQMVGSIIGMFAGLTEAINQKGFGGFMSDAFEDIGGATNSIFKDLFGINLGISGADYKDYDKAKKEYDNLISVWDSLISKKTKYMNIHWGTEATEASKEAQRMLEAEIEQTKIIAQKRLDSGASAGSHSISYRMWKGSYDYNGQNWRDVAGEISNKYGVKFNGMDDLLNMNSDTLSKIKQDYVGLWANMDGDFRDYLEKLIEYGEQADDMIDNITEKLTGNKFSSLVESWGDAMSQMSNSSDSLVDNFEDNLKKTIVNSMIENLYKDKINKVLDKAKKYGDPTGGTANKTDANGNIISAFTESEYSEVMGDVEDVAKQIEATRDFLKKTYGWSDNSSSSSTNSVKGITEETADILLSYVNALRLDCSVIRAEQAKYFPEMSEIAKSQLTQLNMISQNTLRNAEAAERIETVVTSFNDNFNKVLNGTKRLNVK